MFSSKPYAPIVGTGSKVDRRSALEIRFPRLARELAQNWFRPGIDEFLDNLILDDRGGRGGFPLEVIEELMFLADIRWHMQHPVSRRNTGLTADLEFLDYQLPDIEHTLVWQPRPEPSVALFWCNNSSNKVLN